MSESYGFCFGKTFALTAISIVLFSYYFSHDLTAFAQTQVKTVSKSAIIAGEKAAAQSFGQNIGEADLIVSGEYKTEGK
ncbi:MAG: hypothetical protein K2X81_27440, partial [Candidatus Obscuribacterales bacterium]|nr:hypothetical protein [Candidatus Obscuribacterales bacterium]